MNQTEAHNFLGEKEFTQESAAAFLKSDEKMTQEDAVAFLNDEPVGENKIDISPALRTVENIGQVYPALETAATLATTAYGLPISGLTKLAAAPFVGLEKADKAGDWVAEKLIYQPQSKRGQELTEQTFYPIEKLSEFGEKKGDVVLEKTGSPLLAAGTKTAIEAAILVAPGAKALRGKKVTKPKKLAAKTVESKFISEEFAKEFLNEPEIPKPKTPKEKITVPKLKSSEEAVAFGIKATPKEVKALKVLRNKALKEAKNATSPEALNQKAALYKEAIQFAEGRKPPRDIAKRLEKAGIKLKEKKQPTTPLKAEKPKIKAPVKAEKGKEPTVGVEQVVESVLEPHGSVLSQLAHGKEKLIKTDVGVRTIATKRGKEYKLNAYTYELIDGRQRIVLATDPKNLIDAGAVIRPVKDGVVIESLHAGKTGLPNLGGTLTRLIKHKFGKIIPDVEAPLSPAGRKASRKLQKKAPTKVEPDKIGGTTLYGGLPVHKVFKTYEKYIGEPVWDKAIMKGIPKVLEKVPGGKAVNRAFLYEYRGSLAESGKFVKSVDAMKRNQSIGREYAVDLGNRLQVANEATQLKMGEYIKGGNPKLSKNELTLAGEAKQVLYDLGKQAVDLELLSGKTFFKNAGRYMPRLYTSKEYQSLLTQFKVTKPNRLDLSRFQKRKDIPKEVRKEMGEILTPGYPVAKGIMQLTHDIEMAKFFKNTAKNSEWSLPKKSSVAIPEGWKQLPSNKKLGALSESYVHPEIFADISEVIRIQTQGDKIWRKSLGAWKFGKVILSPKTHARNVMSNSILAHLGGMPMYEQPVYLVKAIKAMKGKTDYWKIAKREGLLRETFTNAELRSLFDQVEGQLKGLKTGGLPEKFGTLGTAWGKSKTGMRKAAKLYEAEEQWFKMAKYIHNIERKKMTPVKAAKDAEKWLFNYSKVTKFQEKYRTKWYGAPFATFTFKALPRIAEAAVKTPHRFILPAAMIYGLEEAARNYIGDTKEQVKAKQELRPEYMKGKTLGMSNFPRVPIVDKYGREYYLNLTYILPWGDLAEGGGFMGIPGGLRPFSQPFINEPVQQIANYDFFWKSQIVKEKDIAGKTKAGKIKTETKARVGHLAQTMLPTPFLDAAKIASAAKGVPDYKGRERPGRVVAADVFAGVKMYPVDYIDQMMKEVNRLHPKQGRLGRAIRYDIKILYTKRNAMVKKGKNVKFLDKQIEKKMEQLRGLAGEVKRKVGIFGKIQNN